MKRMSEVFELPVSSRAFGSVYAVSIAPGVHITTASTYAAHAINHVDSLADALEAMIKSHELVGGAPSGYYAVLANAKSALEAYRGTK